MNLPVSPAFLGWSPLGGGRPCGSTLGWWTVPMALVLPFLSGSGQPGQAAEKRSKHVIGATATITEVSTGIPFSARIDTGAKSCSLHVEKIEIKNESPKPLDNLGKSIRFLVMNEKGESDWIETIIAGRVRVRSATQANGDYDGRYRVRLTMQWEDVRKEVSVTLNDRTAMTYPLLVGRDFLRGDFLVDVSKDSDD